MRRSRHPSLFSLSFRAGQLALESQAVAGLRLFQAATGRASPSETTRMVNEKVTALFQAQQAAFVAIMTGQPGAVPARVLRVYGRKVVANRKRLTGS
jgi:hypothetical protein